MDNTNEHLFIGSMRKHPNGEVRLYSEGKLICGAYPFQVLGDIDELRSDFDATDSLVQKYHDEVMDLRFILGQKEEQLAAVEELWREWGAFAPSSWDEPAAELYAALHPNQEGQGND